MEGHDQAKGTPLIHGQRPALLLWLKFIGALKLIIYTLLTTERPHDPLHKVRLGRFGLPVVIKKTLRTASTEADALRFLNAARPGLPIPRILDSFVLGEATYTVMTKLPGENLMDVPLPKAQLRVVANEIKDFLAELWTIPQPAGMGRRVMCSASGDGLPNPMTLHSTLATPFPSTLHCYALMSFKNLEHFVMAMDAEAMQCLANDRVCWVHTDLRLQNILVKDGHLSGVVDWEDSGWLPRHWQLHMFRNVYMHGVTLDWWNIWKEFRVDQDVEDAYLISLGLITYPL